MPRVRQSELLTPTELMVLLHDSENVIGLKSAIEGLSFHPFFCLSCVDLDYSHQYMFLYD